MLVSMKIKHESNLRRKEIKVPLLWKIKTKGKQFRVASWWTSNTGGLRHTCNTNEEANGSEWWKMERGEHEIKWVNAIQKG